MTVTPGALNFGKVALNTPSIVKAVTLKNSTGSTFTIASIANANPDFVASQNCVTTLGATSCAASVTFTPSTPSRETDVLTLTDALDGIVKTVKLIGTGQ